MPWLQGHMLQGQTVFPATGYVSMAIEATRILALDTYPYILMSLLQIKDLNIQHSIAFDDGTTSVETIFSASSVAISEQALTAQWTCCSVAEGAIKPVMNAKGRMSCQFSAARPGTLPVLKTDPYDLVHIDKKQFYGNLSRIGYDYAPPFRGLSHIRRELGRSFGTLAD
ncbi:MAG: hypothetical protein Q9202_007390 [Teloschistes flavicans]